MRHRIWGVVLYARNGLPEIGKEREDMPIYEFKCSVCGAVAEVLQRMDAPAPLCSECPQDGSESPAMVKQVSCSSFVLKGGGWAADGYK